MKLSYNGHIHQALGAYTELSVPYRIRNAKKRRRQASRCMKDESNDEKGDLKRPPAVAGGYTNFFLLLLCFPPFPSPTSLLLITFSVWAFGFGAAVVRIDSCAHPHHHTQRSKCKSVFLPFETEAQPAILSSCVLPLSNVVLFELFTFTSEQPELSQRHSALFIFHLPGSAQPTIAI